MSTPGAVGALVAEAAGGSRRATGRLLSLAERDDPALEGVRRPGSGAHVIGITGAPGAGKSTLTGHLAARLADRSRVAVLAIDPSSPLSGGAILGDRVRMDEVLAGRDVFVRSMATRGSGGGLSAAVPEAIRVLEAVGFDVVIVETVGVGQIEVDVAAAADTTLVVVTPGWGDAVQANKAGLLEVADAFVINKADRPGAEDTRRDLELMLDLTADRDDGWRPPIVTTVATTASGLDELIGAIDAHRSLLGAAGGSGHRHERTLLEVRARVGAAVDDALASVLRAPGVADEVDAVARGDASLRALVDRVRRILIGERPARDGANRG